METLGLLTFLILVLHTYADKPEPIYLKEYIYVEKKLSWYDARMYCTDHYNELFRISDGNNLKDLSGSAKQLSWIGLFRWGIYWKWVDDSKALYLNWYRLGDCATTTNIGFWIDMPCDNIATFVCQDSPGIWNVGTSGQSWFVAKQICENNHRGLAIIRHETDNNNISNVIPQHSWIGLSKVIEDTPLKDTWRWVNNEPLTYSRWFTPFFCAVMDSRGFWYDRVCFEKHPFVCFRENNNIPEYSPVSEDKTWNEAQSHCKMLSMNLVMVKTQEDNTALLSAISGFLVNNLYLWIGLQNDPWFWSEGSSPSRNWNSMQPDGKDFWNKPLPNIIHNCVASMDGEWFDEDCVMPLPFFCSATVRSTIVVSEPKSWEEALEHCRDKYIDLASLASDAEQLVVTRKLKDVQVMSVYVWTGLRFLSGSWFWVYGDSLQYENWLDGGQQQCPVTHRCGALAVASGKWEARPCEERLSFLCFQN